MANRRMISRTISTSKQVNSMSEFAQLLFTWAIAHADDFGCMDGDPDVVLATVIPMKRERSSQDVSDAIGEWVDASLVWWYEYDSQVVIQFRSWDKQQSGLHKRTASKYPQHEECKSDSGKFREIHGDSLLTELNRTELNRREENDESLILSAYKQQAATVEPSSSDSSSSSSDVSKVSTAFQAEIGQVSPFVKDDLLMLVDEYTADWVVDAIRESTTQGVRKLSYVKKILRNWHDEGRGVKRIDMSVTATRAAPVSVGKAMPTGMPPEALQAMKEDEERERQRRDTG